MSKFNLMADNTEVGIVYKSAGNVPFRITKTIYDL